MGGFERHLGDAGTGFRSSSSELEAVLLHRRRQLIEETLHWNPLRCLGALSRRKARFKSGWRSKELEIPVETNSGGGGRRRTSPLAESGRTSHVPEIVFDNIYLR